VLLAILIAATTLPPSDQVALERYGAFLDQVEVCREMGYGVASGDRWMDDVLRDTGAGDKGRLVMSRAMAERRRDQDAMLLALAKRIDATSGPADLEAAAQRLADGCDAVRRDERGARLVTSAAPLDAAAIWADRILESAGRASWQTPAMREAYSAMITVGLCGRVGPDDQVERTRRAALATTNDDPRTEAYVEGGLGMADVMADHTKPDRALCARLLAEDRVRIEHAR